MLTEPLPFDYPEGILFWIDLDLPNDPDPDPDPAIINQTQLINCTDPAALCFVQNYHKMIMTTLFKVIKVHFDHHALDPEDAYIESIQALVNKPTNPGNYDLCLNTYLKIFLIIPDKEFPLYPSMQSFALLVPLWSQFSRFYHPEISFSQCCCSPSLWSLHLHSCYPICDNHYQWFILPISFPSISQIFSSILYHYSDSYSHQYSARYHPYHADHAVRSHQQQFIVAWSNTIHCNVDNQPQSSACSFDYDKSAHNYN